MGSSKMLGLEACYGAGSDGAIQLPKGGGELMCNIDETLALRPAVVALAGVLAWLLQSSAARAQTYLFNKSDPAAVVTGDFKNGPAVAAAPEVDANFASRATDSPSRRLKRAIKHYQSAGQALDRGDIDGAVAEYRKALEEDPDEPYWHLALAMALKRKGDRQGILDDYEVARKLVTDDAALRAAYESPLAPAMDEQAASAGAQGEAIGAIHEVGSGVSAPSCAHCPDPRYAKKARAAKYQATCVVQIIVNAREGTSWTSRWSSPLGSDLMKMPPTRSALGSSIRPSVRVFRSTLVPMFQDSV
jgi:tetratricopeptide (TPR) repeat protein